MNDKRKKRYTLDFDETDSRPRKKPGKSVSRNTRTMTGAGSQRTAGIDTNQISRSLENQADEHVNRSRRETHYSTGPVDQYTPTRRSQPSYYAAEERRVAPVTEPDDPEKRYKERRRLRREAAKWKRMHWTVRFLILVVLILDILVLRFGVFRGGFMPVLNILKSSGKQTISQEADGPQFTILEDYLTVNEFSRPGTKLDAVNGIVIHYIGNPGTDAQANRDYFESLKDGSTGAFSSANYIIGLDGTIIHCVPDDEVAYASGERNNDTISIECCHPDESGAFTQETFNALVLLTAKLCGDYNLTTDNLLRHYDVNGKPCPRFFVEDPDAWSNFLASVEACM